jgi:hypothetical protein
MTERTEPELSEAYEKERSALVGAQDELKAMQKRRVTLLRTAGTPEDVLSLDDETRLESIKIEIASARMAPLKNELDMVRQEAAKWAGVDMPSVDELDKLLAIVTAARPDLNLAREQGRFDISERDHRAEFRRAFYAIGRMGRLNEPDGDRYFHAVVDDVNRVLNARRLGDVGGDAVMCALLAWGDVPHRPADAAAFGQLTEVAIAKINQGTPAVAKWRKILSGEANLVAPLPPRGMRASSSTYPSRPVRIYQEDADGVMRESPPIAPLLVQ